jgi:uncharacterized protein (TIGR00251 family)
MNDDLNITQTPSGLRIPIRVIPRSPRDRIDQVRAGRLLVRVTAPPVDSAANEAVVALLARTFDVPRGSIRIVSGATGRNKTVEIAGLTESQVRGIRFRS